MPKIIENLETRLIEEAEAQIREKGYGAVTIRSVAAACGVGVGTVYNYFPSKDALLAAYMLRDWQVCIHAIAQVSHDAAQPLPVLQCIHTQLLEFSARHQSVFSDAAAAASFGEGFGRYHQVLRAQLAKPLRRFCESDFAAEFVAEALLTWTMAGKEFPEIYGIIGKLL